MRKRLLRVAASAIALTLLAPACFWSHKNVDLGVFFLTEQTGAVEVRTAVTAPWTVAPAGARVAPGSTLRIGPGGTAKLTRGEASTVEIRPFQSTPAELLVSSPSEVGVSAGDVLVTSAAAVPISVRAQDVTTSSATGTYRVDRRLSLRVGVYDGSANVASSGGSIDIGPLREGILSAGLPRTLEPLHFDTQDPWDRRLLVDVIDLDRELESQGRAYESGFGASVSSVRALGVLDPGTSFGFVAKYLASKRSSDILLGTVLTLLVKAHRGGSRGRILDDVMSAREQGATWGLLARQNGVDAAEYRDDLARAIGLLTGDIHPQPVVRPSPVPTPTSSPSPHPSPSPTMSQHPNPSPSPSPSHSPPPSPTPTPCSPIDQLLHNC